MKKIKNWKSFNEDVYYGTENVYENDEEFEYRMSIWLNNFINEQVGLETAYLSHLSDDNIIITYVKERKWQNRPERKIAGPGKKVSKEELMEMDKENWREMAEDLIHDMSYYDDGRGLGMELSEDDYVIYVNPNGFEIKFEKKIPRFVTGERENGPLGSYRPSSRYEAELKKIEKLKAEMEADIKRVSDYNAKHNITR